MQALGKIPDNLHISKSAVTRVWTVHEKNGLDPVPNFTSTISADPDPIRFTKALTRSPANNV